MYGSHPLWRLSTEKQRNKYNKFLYFAHLKEINYSYKVQKH